MGISIFDIFSVGIGPSSSHTVGPMKAAYNFMHNLDGAKLLKSAQRICIELYGSLALTGKGHGTEPAILNGLEGQQPRTVDPTHIVPRASAIKDQQMIKLFGKHTIPFHPKTDFLFHYQELLPLHSNGMRFTAFDAQGNTLQQEIYYSIGGGFIVTADQFHQQTPKQSIPFPFTSAQELLDHCQAQHKTIAEIVLANEMVWRTNDEIRHDLLAIANVMHECVVHGCHTEGILPGGLNVKRRAPDLFKKLQAQNNSHASLWPAVYAMAVNEENASGGRIVTAPTNGAAGIIPAVLEYYRNFDANANDDKVIEFLLTAGAIAILYKTGASISGAEVGCQGEVGVACSMAAGALAAIWGGTLAQIENAAEIAMEHHLGMTCDPIGGLVQIPCIERNGIGAEKAIKIAQLALLEDGRHKVSLDNVIATMLQTGKDMQSIYKETSLGGLAKKGLRANLPEC